jgi:hypothetical protein
MGGNTLDTLNLSSPSPMVPNGRGGFGTSPGINRVHTIPRGGGNCLPVIAANVAGVVFAFAGSGCDEDGSVCPPACPDAGGPAGASNASTCCLLHPGSFSLPVIVAYDPVQESAAVYGDIPPAVYEHDKDAGTGPVFGAPFLNEGTGVLYVISESNVVNYELTLAMLLEFNPRSGKTTALATFDEDHDISAAVFEPKSQLIVLAIDVHTYANGCETPGHLCHRLATFNTRTSTLSALHNDSSAYAAMVSSRVAGFDPVAKQNLVIKNVGGVPRSKTNYEFGHLSCSETGCDFTSAGELDQLWCPDSGYGALDKISSVAWDPAERLLSVVSSGCYNVSHEPFDCYSNLGTNKFMQYTIPADTSPDPGRVVKATYAYMQPTNYNDGLTMDFSQLASGGTPQ